MIAEIAGGVVAGGLVSKALYDNIGLLRSFASGEESFEELNRQLLIRGLRRDGFTDAQIEEQLTPILQRNSESLTQHIFGEEVSIEEQERIAEIVRKGLNNNKDFSEVMTDIDIESGVELPDLWKNTAEEEGTFLGGGDGGIIEGEPSGEVLSIKERTSRLLGLNEDGTPYKSGGVNDETEPLLGESTGAAAEEAEKAPSLYDRIFKPKRTADLKTGIFDQQRAEETDALLQPSETDDFGGSGAMMDDIEFKRTYFEPGTENMDDGKLLGSGEGGAEDVYITTQKRGTLLESDIEKTIQAMIDAGEITGEGAVGAAQQEVIIDNVIKNLGEGAGIETAIETGVSTAGYSFVEGAGSLGVGLLISAIDGTGSQAVDLGLGAAGGLGVATATAFAPETLGASLIIGGALYGLTKGAEAIGTAAGIGREAQKQYHYEQNEQKGSHQMDEKEIKYALSEVNSGIKYYEDQVKYHYSVSNKDPKAIAKHEQDKQMLQALKESKASLEKGKSESEAVYVMVGDGFNADKLSPADKKTYDELVKKEDRIRDKVYYHGGDRDKLERRKAETKAFIEEHSDSAMPTNYVNAASQEQLDQANENYVKYGGEAYGTLTPQQLDLLGYTQARTDDVEADRLKVENAVIDAKADLQKLKLEQAGLVAEGDGVGSIM